jgi:hypothetical protein
MDRKEIEKAAEQYMWDEVRGMMIDEDIDTGDLERDFIAGAEYVLSKNVIIPQSVVDPSTKKENMFFPPSPFVNITDDVYKNLADSLLYAIIDRDVFNDWVRHDDGQFEYKLTITAIIYRKEIITDDFNCIAKGEITDIIPVWWNIEIKNPENGVSLNNDFNWTIFKKYLVF